MKILGWLFGGSKAADKTIDGISKGLDKLVYTEEEKADAHKEGFKLWLEYQKATQPQNVARRALAMLVAILWVGLVVAGVALYRIDLEYSKFIFKVLTEIVNNPFMLIMGFYFFKRIVNGFKKEKD